MKIEKMTFLEILRLFSNDYISGSTCHRKLLNGSF